MFRTIKSLIREYRRCRRLGMSRKHSYQLATFYAPIKFGVSE